MAADWNQWEDLSPEQEEELIEKLAQFFVKRGLGLIARMTLESGGNLTSLFAEFYMGVYGPYFDFMGVDRYVAVLRRKSNSQRIIARIEALEKAGEKPPERPPAPS